MQKTLSPEECEQLATQKTPAELVAMIKDLIERRRRLAERCERMHLSLAVAQQHATAAEGLVLGALSQDVEYRPGPPSPYQVQAQEARGGFWQMYVEGRPRAPRTVKLTIEGREIAFRGEDGEDHLFVDVLDLVEDAPRGARKWRPCTPKGTPLSWPGESIQGKFGEALDQALAENPAAALQRMRIATQLRLVGPDWDAEGRILETLQTLQDRLAQAEAGDLASRVVELTRERHQEKAACAYLDRLLSEGAQRHQAIIESMDPAERNQAEIARTAYDRGRDEALARVAGWLGVEGCPTGECEGDTDDHDCEHDPAPAVETRIEAMRSCLIRLHRQRILSERQAAGILGIDRVRVRRLADELPESEPVERSGE